MIEIKTALEMKKVSEEHSDQIIERVIEYLYKRITATAEHGYTRTIEEVVGFDDKEAEKVLEFFVNYGYRISYISRTELDEEFNEEFNVCKFDIAWY